MIQLCKQDSNESPCSSMAAPACHNVTQFTARAACQQEYYCFGDCQCIHSARFGHESTDIFLKRGGDLQWIYIGSPCRTRPLMSLSSLHIERCEASKTSRIVSVLQARRRTVIALNRMVMSSANSGSLQTSLPFQRPICGDCAINYGQMQEG